MSTLNPLLAVFAVLASAPPWFKVVLFFVGWVGVWLPIAVPVALVVKWRPFQPLTLQQKLPLVISLYLLAPLVLAGFAWLEAGSLTQYGFAWQPHLFRSFVLGITLGTIGVLVLFACEHWAGWVQWQLPPRSVLVAALIPTFLIGLFIGGIEELIFRGFLVNQVGQMLDPWLAAIVSSAIFALLHWVWEGSVIMPQLPGLWLMGMVLCLARVADQGSLGLAWGLHAGWVWIMASLDSAQMLSYTGKSPDWLTGINQQPLAGVLGFVFLLATAGVVWLTVLAG